MISVVIYPTGRNNALVQVVYPAWAGITLVVAVERQRRVLLGVHNIGLFPFSEVTRVARAAVDVGIGIVPRVGFTIGCALTAHQTGTFIEH